MPLANMPLVRRPQIPARRPGAAAVTTPVAPALTQAAAPATAAPPLTKGTGATPANFAQGGPVISQRSQFMKTPDVFRTDIERTDYNKKSPGGEMSNPKGDGKSLPAIKPKT